MQNFYASARKEGDICVYGKNVLGEIGLSLNRKLVLKYGLPKFLDNFDKIEEISSLKENQKIIMTAMTDLGDLQRLAYTYIPTIVTYDSLAYGSILDPKYMLESVFLGNSFPSADFIVWNPQDNVLVSTFSKTAPTIYFETAEGRKCLGTILRGALMNDIDYIFNKIFYELGANCGNKVKVVLVTSTDVKYREYKSTIYDYIKRYLNAREDVSSFKFMYPVESNASWLYQADDIGNNVIVCG